jgi:hypothetical protein
VIERLPQMSEDELRDLATRVSYLLDPAAKITTVKPSSRRHRKPDENLQLLWDEMKYVLDKACGTMPPLPVFMRQRQMAGTMRAASEAIVRMVQDVFKTNHRAERVKVVRLIVGLTADDLDRRGSLTPLRLAQRLRRAEQTLDRHFPGYRQSGMLPMVLKQVRE